jgi:hypothetical protein
MALRDVQKIACTNETALTIQFCVAYDTGYTRSTKDISFGQTRVIDLTTVGIPDGTAVWPVVHAEGGGSNDGAGG